MTPEISERAFEEAIECALLRHGPDACPGDATAVRESAPPYGEDPLPGGYRRRRPEEYDRGLCLIQADVLDFLLATQPKEWEKLKQHHGAEVKARFLDRIGNVHGLANRLLQPPWPPLARIMREVASRGRLCACLARRRGGFDWKRILTIR